MGLKNPFLLFPYNFTGQSQNRSERLKSIHELGISLEKIVAIFWEKVGRGPLSNSKWSGVKLYFANKYSMLVPVSIICLSKIVIMFILRHWVNSIIQSRFLGRKPLSLSRLTLLTSKSPKMNVWSIVLIHKEWVNELHWSSDYYHWLSKF